MNKIYKVVWNTVRNCYVVGSELISSKSGRHSTSNGKSSSLKVTLTVLALCGMTALGSGVAPAYAANAGTAVESQYVAVLVNSSNNSRRDYRDFDGYSYHKERIASTGDVYWVRDGYTIKYEADKRYPGARNANIIKAYKTSSYTTASDAGLLKSNQIMVESAGISTLTGVDLDDVSGGTYVGATNSGSTSTPSSFNYMIKDDNGTYVDAGNTNFSERFKAATKNKDGTYSYKGEVIANDNLYVVDEQVGVFLTSSGKVYTGKVFGANNEVLMTTKSAEGTMYSYWGADTPDPNTKLADMTIGQFNQALEKVNNNSKAVAGDTIKKIKTTAKTDGGTIDLVRRGQYNSATGQYEGEYTVGDGITITSHGGTNGKDVKINFSNGTTGFDVAAGSKVEAIKATESTTDITGLKINGKTYNIKTGQTYTEGNNITIDGNKISATDTTLVAGKAEKTDDNSYIVKDTAGHEVTLEDVASASKLTEVNNQVTKNTQDITNNANNITNLGKQLEGAVMYDSTPTGFDKNNVTLGGTTYDSKKKTGGTKITNLARGTNDSDAVNFSQLSEIKNAGTNGGFGLTVDSGDSVKKNLGETVTVKGDGTNITTKVDNGTIKVELNKNINLGNDGSVTAGNTTINNKGVDTNQVKVGDITITKDGINGGKQQITNIGSGLDGKTYNTTMSGQENWNNAASIGDVHTIARDEAGKAAEAVKAKSGKNITVDTDNRVNLNDDITLGTNSSKQVKVDGTNGRVVIGSGNTAVTLGQQSNTSGDSNPAEGNYLTGLDNKNWDASYIQSGRAATEDQLKAVDDKVSSGRKFTGDDGKQLTVALGQNLSLTGGAQTDNLSDGNIGVVKNGESGLSVKLSKDLTGLNSVTIKTSDADRTISIADGNVNMGGNTVSGVADGQVAPGSTDAVNGSQLYATNQKVTANTENINNLTQTVNNNTESISTLNQTVDNHTESINVLTDAVVTNAENINSLSHSLNKLDSRINRVGAGAAALAALHPLDFDPDNKWDFAAGYGNYAGANAVAIGTYYRPNENTMFSIGGSFGGGENMINAGVSFKLGSGGSGITTSKTVMAKKIKEQDELLKAQDAKMKEQDEKIAKLEALVAQQGEMIQQALGKK